MIFVDSNIPMYLVGQAHPNKEKALNILRQVTRQNIRLVTNTEVFQEICHHYTAIQKKEAILPCFDALLAIVDQVLQVDMTIIRETHRLLLSYQKLSARDAIHLASMKINNIETILTFDTDFDLFTDIQRMPL